MFSRRSLMRFRAKAIFKTVLLILFLLPLMAEAIDIVVTGDWRNLFISTNDLAAGPGSNLNEQYESNIDQVIIDIVNTSGNSDAWRVDVKRTDATWSSIPVIYVKRYGSGSGEGSISGGLGYQMVGTSDMTFFSGTGDRTGIQIQLKISNMSLSLSPGDYSTTISYTVVDI